LTFDIPEGFKMGKEVRSIVITGHGTHCEMEMGLAFFRNAVQYIRNHLL
jgi:hypothetical protein